MTVAKKATQGSGKELVMNTKVTPVAKSLRHSEKSVADPGDRGAMATKGTRIDFIFLILTPLPTPPPGRCIRYRKYL